MDIEDEPHYALSFWLMVALAIPVFIVVDILDAIAKAKGQ